jgi:hypothetical protein
MLRIVKVGMGKKHNSNDKHEFMRPKELKKHIINKVPIFMLVYMNGCGACEAMYPEWSKISNVNFKNILPNNKFIVADIEHNSLPNNIIVPSPNSFPTIKHIHNDHVSDYEDYTDDINTPRTIDSFVNWIKHELKNKAYISNNNQMGGTNKTRRYRRNLKTHKYRKTRKNRTRRNYK